ncbi:MAG TPA: tetratricopeptide repeat protein [Chthoniobacterales bacterium]|nr:tetratricopeptide repeat protein [Chthoniobacterales bacterium]
MAKQTAHKKRQRNASGQRQFRQQQVRRRVVERGHSTTTFGRNDLFIAFGLVAVTLTVYAQVMSHQFIILDDNRYIRENPMVNRGLTLTGIAWAFTTFHAANWHPLTWLSHMLDSQIFGLNAGGHLLVNALIHASNTVLLFLFLRRVTGAKWQSAIVAALFALHPLHVESVAWAAERKDTLSTFFGLLSLVAYARYVERTSVKRYVLVAVALALGLMAKPMLVTWPFVLLLLDYWPLRRYNWQPATGTAGFVRALAPLVREKLPLFCLAAASMVITFIAQSHGGAVRTLVDVPVSLRLSNAVVSYAKYLFLTVWPSHLAVYYPFSRTGVPAWQLLCAIVLLAVITSFALRQATERPYLLMGWLWFVGTLVPVIGLLQVGGAAMADRYHYVPSIGLFVAFVFGLSDIARAFRIDRVAMGMLTVAALSILACLTAVQIGRWRNSATLFQYTLSLTPDNRMIENNLGTILGDSGRYDEAAAHFAKALQIKPDFLEVINDADIRGNLGMLLARQGRAAEAVEQLNEALRLNPNSAEAHNNLGVVLLRLGKAEESIPHFSAAIRLKPELAVARDNLKRAESQINTRR